MALIPINPKPYNDIFIYLERMIKMRSLSSGGSWTLYSSRILVRSSNSKYLHIYQSNFFRNYSQQSLVHAYSLHHLALKGLLKSSGYIWQYRYTLFLWVFTKFAVIIYTWDFMNFENVFTKWYYVMEKSNHN